MKFSNYIEIFEIFSQYTEDAMDLIGRYDANCEIDINPEKVSDDHRKRLRELGCSEIRDVFVV